MFTITEHISWNRMEFNFQGFRDLANKLQMFKDLMKLHNNRKYKIIIEEIL